MVYWFPVGTTELIEREKLVLAFLAFGLKLLDRLGCLVVGNVKRGLPLAQRLAGRGDRNQAKRGDIIADRHGCIENRVGA